MMISASRTGGREKTANLLPEAELGKNTAGWRAALAVNSYWPHSWRSFVHIGSAWWCRDGAGRKMMKMRARSRPSEVASLADKYQKIAIIFFYPTRKDHQDVFARLQSIRAGGSYPLFLWITLCIRVRKHKVSERRRGLRLNWCERRLEIIVIKLQCVR